MAMQHQNEIMVNRSPIEVFNFLSSQRTIGELQLEQSLPESYVLTFIIPNTNWKAGHLVTISIFDNGQGGTIVRVLSVNLKVTQIFDGGKNKNNCDIICNAILSVFR